MANSWYMAGTEGTGEYIVALCTRLGRVGYRLLDREDSYRIRVEPEPSGRDQLARLFTPRLGWKQPGDAGQDRFSIQVTKEQFPEALGLAIQALEPEEAGIEVNPLAPEWVQQLVKQAVQAKTARYQVFFCYSHKDKKWLDLIRTTLKPAKLSDVLWDDTRIDPGAKWRDEIRKSLASAKVAVLLVSRNFLASDFIQKNELPPLLKAEREQELIILWVLVGHCMYKVTEIEQYQAVYDLARPLNSLSAPGLDKALVEIGDKIIAAAK